MSAYGSFGSEIRRESFKNAIYILLTVDFSYISIANVGKAKTTLFYTGKGTLRESYVH